MIKGIIFDIGGVLVRTHDRTGRRDWEARLGLEPGGMEWLVFNSETGRRAQLGQASPDDVWSGIAAQLSLSASELERLQRDFWAGDRLDTALCEYIRSLRGRYRTGMLSNAWARDGRAMAERLGFADCFDAFVTSAEVGVMKPAPYIYQVMLDRLGLAPCEGVFVDDFVENVEAARRLGMAALHFVDPGRLRQELDALLAG
jgi:HAD superfamily hydrolase (TIGR01509 family)